MSTETFPRFYFEEKAHTYTVGRGRGLRKLVVPSVTQLIREVGYIDWLDWIDPSTLQAAQERGTRIHSAVEQLNRCRHRRKTSQAAMDTMDALERHDELGYLSSYLEFLDQSGARVVPKSIEKRFVHKSRLYAGCLDFELLPRALTLSPILVDLKSGGYDPAARLQTAAYLARSAGEGGRLPTKPEDLPDQDRAVLLLKENGSVGRLRVFPACDNWADWLLFRAAVDVHYGKERLSVFR